MREWSKQACIVINRASHAPGGSRLPAGLACAEAWNVDGGVDREGPSHSPPCGQLLAWMKQQMSVPGRGPFWETTADPSQPSLAERKTLWASGLQKSYPSMF